MNDSIPLHRLESMAWQSWFALDDGEKQDSLIRCVSAIWVLMGRGNDVDEVLADAECGLIVGATRLADELFGFPEGLMSGTLLRDRIPESLREIHDRHFAGFCLLPEVRQMGGQRGELPGLKQDGTEILLEIGLFPTTIRRRRVAVGILHQARKLNGGKSKH